MIDEAEKQRMMEFLRNPHPIALEFEAKQVPPDLFKLMGIDDTFSNDYHFVYGADEAEDDEDEIAVWPDRIVKSGRATIVFWDDGTKTVVKRSPDEPDNDYNAFLAALGIKIFGSNSQLKKIIKEQTVNKRPKKRKETVCKMSAKEFEQFGDNLIEKYSAKDACPIDKPCEETLNDKAKQQYQEYLASDKWTCPKCGRQYQWQYNDAGRYAFCPKCQLAVKEGEKA